MIKWFFTHTNTLCLFGKPFLHDQETKRENKDLELLCDDVKLLFVPPANPSKELAVPLNCSNNALKANTKLNTLFSS